MVGLLLALYGLVVPALVANHIATQPRGTAYDPEPLHSATAPPGEMQVPVEMTPVTAAEVTAAVQRIVPDRSLWPMVRAVLLALTNDGDTIANWNPGWIRADWRTSGPWFALAMESYRRGRPWYALHAFRAFQDLDSGVTALLYALSPAMTDDIVSHARAGHAEPVARAVVAQGLGGIPVEMLAARIRARLLNL